jgi:hypothetical protein
LRLFAAPERLDGQSLKVTLLLRRRHTVHSRDLSSFDVPALSARLHALASEERTVQSEFLRHLDELDRRRGFAELGYPSLWEYCLRALHLREGAAGRRIGATRVLRRFPGLADPLRDGRLCLTTLCLLAPVLTEENVAAVTTRAAFKTKAQVEELVVSLKPRHAPADGVRRVAAAAPPAAEAGVAPRIAEATIARIPPLLSGSAAAPVPEATANEPSATSAPVPPPLALAAANDTPAAALPAVPVYPPRRPELRAVAAETWSLRVTLDADAKQDLETLTQLLSHKVPAEISRQS